VVGIPVAAPPYAFQKTRPTLLGSPPWEIGGQAGKFIKHRAQLLGALNRVLTGLDAMGSKTAECHALGKAGSTDASAPHRRCRRSVR
jgi:hypothetical protein